MTAQMMRRKFTSRWLTTSRTTPKTKVWKTIKREVTTRCTSGRTCSLSEVLMDRYVIMQKLGWGHFSTVWLARDFKYDTYVAIKVQKSANHYLDAAFDEVELLQKAAKYSGSEEWKERLRKIHGVAVAYVERLKEAVQP